MLSLFGWFLVCFAIIWTALLVMCFWSDYKRWQAYRQEHPEPAEPEPTLAAAIAAVHAELLPEVPAAAELPPVEAPPPVAPAQVGEAPWKRDKGGRFSKSAPRKIRDGKKPDSK